MTFGIQFREGQLIIIYRARGMGGSCVGMTEPEGGEGGGVKAKVVEFYVFFFNRFSANFAQFWNTILHSGMFRVVRTLFNSLFFHSNGIRDSILKQYV